MATPQPTPVFFPGKAKGQRSLVGHSARGHTRGRRGLKTKQQQHNYLPQAAPLCAVIQNS